MKKTAPVETKVVAGTAGAGAGAVISQFILWMLGCWAWGAPWAAGKAADAVAAVPGPVSGLVVLVVTVIGAYGAGWLAPHTPRPAPTPAVTPPKPVKLVHPDAGLDVLHTEPLPKP